MKKITIKPNILTAKSGIVFFICKPYEEYKYLIQITLRKCLKLWEIKNNLLVKLT